MLNKQIQGNIHGSKVKRVFVCINVYVFRLLMPSGDIASCLLVYACRFLVCIRPQRPALVQQQRELLPLPLFCRALTSPLPLPRALTLSLSPFPPQRGETTWGNTTANLHPRFWTIWPRTRNSTRQSSSSGTRASSKTAPLGSSTWRSFSSSMLRWGSRWGRAEWNPGFRSGWVIDLTVVRMGGLFRNWWNIYPTVYWNVYSVVFIITFWGKLLQEWIRLGCCIPCWILQRPSDKRGTEWHWLTLQGLPMLKDILNLFLPNLSSLFMPNSGFVTPKIAELLKLFKIFPGILCLDNIVMHRYITQCR